MCVCMPVLKGKVELSKTLKKESKGWVENSSVLKLK